MERRWAREGLAGKPEGSARMAQQFRRGLAEAPLRRRRSMLARPLLEAWQGCMLTTAVPIAGRTR